MDDEKHFKERIEKILSEHSEGLSITEISKLVGANRHTITKYIHELIGAGIIYQRDLGTIKLHYLASKLSMKKISLIGKLERLNK